MNKVQIGVDASGIQSLTPTPKMGFGGAYQSRNITLCSRVGQALFGAVHPGERSHDFLSVPAREPFSLFLQRRDGLFKATEKMRRFEFESLRHILYCVPVKRI